MKLRHRLITCTVVLSIAIFLMIWRLPSTSVPPVAVEKPVLSVEIISPQQNIVPQTIMANGNIMAWQEASIGPEANGLRLIDVKVNIGDTVKRGQLLASFATDTIQAELVQSRTTVSEATVALADAAANAQRAKLLKDTGAISAQEIQQLINTERAAQARLDSALALEKIYQLKLKQTHILAPDDGVISAHIATVGAVMPTGQELFRLIRHGRLEWRAEVAEADLIQLKVGQIATLTLSHGETIQGKIRMIAPVVDVQTRNALVYVDLAANPYANMGMFAQGTFTIAQKNALTLPQSAVFIQDGFHFVLTVNASSRVQHIPVKIGQSFANQIEIIEGLTPLSQVIATGGGFLREGDLVRVLDTSTAHREVNHEF